VTGKQAQTGFPTYDEADHFLARWAAEKKGLAVSKTQAQARSAA
jgi:hypothetical protein